MRSWTYAACAWLRRACESAGLLLTLYILLDAVATLVWTLVHPAPAKQGGPLIIPLVIFFAWRVSRGGWLSRVFLIIQTTLSYGSAALTLARTFNGFVLVALALYAAQFAVLFSPAVSVRVRRDEPAATPRRLIPPAWLLAFGVLAGLIVTLISVSHMGFIPEPGCGRPGTTQAQLPLRCFTLGRGYPLRFLTAMDGTPDIDPGLLIRDWTQWTVVSLSVLYGLWLRLSPRPRPELQTRRQRASASP